MLTQQYILNKGYTLNTVVSNTTYHQYRKTFKLGLNNVTITLQYMVSNDKYEFGNDYSVSISHNRDGVILHSISTVDELKELERFLIR